MEEPEEFETKAFTEAFNLDPILDETVPEFTLCGECIFWKNVEGDDRHRCRKYAPRPEIENSYASTTQNVVWPAPKNQEGCFEGYKKEEIIEPEEKPENNETGCGGCSSCKEENRLVNKNTNMSNCV
jgi:hypothetical protein